MTVQGHVKEQQPDGMSHRGGGGGAVRTALVHVHASPQVRNFLECEVPLFTDMRQAFDESAEKDLTAPKEILEIEDF